MSNKNAAEKTEETLHVGTFFINDEEYGVEILKIREIINVIEITKVPRASEFIEGAINLRGTIIPLINLRNRFGLPPREFDSRTRIINMEVGNIVIGIIVDAIGKVFRIPKNLVEEAPPVVASIDSEYISGVGKLEDEDRLLIILDADKLCSTEALIELGQIAEG